MKDWRIVKHKINRLGGDVERDAWRRIDVITCAWENRDHQKATYSVADGPENPFDVLEEALKSYSRRER